MLQHTVSADVDTRIWDGTHDPDLIAWLGEDDHRFDGTQLIIQTADGDLYPEPGWTIVRWPDRDLSVLSPRAVVKCLVPGARATDAAADIQRVAALHDRWVKAGPPPLGTSISRWWDRRLAELHKALAEPKEH